jgi:hypothetical protein
MAVGLIDGWIWSRKNEAKCPFVGFSMKTARFDL